MKKQSKSHAFGISPTKASYTLVFPMSVSNLGDEDSYCYGSIPKRPRLSGFNQEASGANTSMTSNFTPSKTANEISNIMNALRIDHVAGYFDRDVAKIDPYLVCDGVSSDAFNKYIGDGEGLQVALRFLELNDKGQIFIVELPTRVHESTSQEFTSHFLAATGNSREIAKGGSMTASRAGFPKKEADATFGPKRSTPNRTPPPAPRTIADWVTLAVEVGRWQPWASLERAARWWCEYSGIQYILLLKVSASATQIEYRLYDIVTPRVLSQPLRHRTRLRDPERPTDNVTLDMRRILSIPANQPLPNGVNPYAAVNLRTVMSDIIRSL